MSLICHSKKILGLVSKIQQSASISPTANYSSCDGRKCPSIRMVGCGPRLRWKCEANKKRCKCVKVDPPLPSFSECLRCPPPRPRITECPLCCSAFSPRPNPPKHCVKPNLGISIDACNPPDSIRMLGSCRRRNLGCKRVNKPCVFNDPSVAVCDPCIEPYRNECPPCTPATARKSDCNKANSGCNSQPVCDEPKPDCVEPVNKQRLISKLKSKLTCDKPIPVCFRSPPPCLQQKPEPACEEPVPDCCKAVVVCDSPKPVLNEPQPLCEPKPICNDTTPCQTEDVPICCCKAVCDLRTTPEEMKIALKTCRPCEEDQVSEVFYAESTSCSKLQKVSRKNSAPSLFDYLLDLVNLRRK